MKQFLAKEAVPVFGWTEGVPVDNKALEQIRSMAKMPFIHKHIAIMPDVHWGMGATVGSVIPALHAIIPAAVGVDIGCGMMAIRTSLTAEDLPDNLFDIRSLIESAVPHGRSNNGASGDVGAHQDIQELPNNLLERLNVIVGKHTALSRAQERAVYHIGTLGTGNHFIELCLDENNDVWIMLHSGSRGIGNKIGTYFIEKAKEDMRRYHINLPDEDLAYIPEGSLLFNDYMEALGWAQEFAMENRKHMMKAVIRVLNNQFKRNIIGHDAEIAVNCHHNYVSREKHFGKNVLLTRKGAVSAKKGELGIIPGSMGAKSFIVRGKGNHESFCSCSHGAGRIMSRTQAAKEVSLEKHIEDTMGVECRKDMSVIDETPSAYKNIDAVMKAQDELVEIVHTLKQVLCVKG
jgi:tRNA-splicing ligase RtcB